MLKWRVLAIVGLSCGVAGVAWGYTQHARDPGFFELRIYTTLLGQRDPLAARFGDCTTKIYERQRIRNVGCLVCGVWEESGSHFRLHARIPVAGGTRRAPCGRARRFRVSRGRNGGGAQTPAPDRSRRCNLWTSSRPTTRPSDRSRT